MAHAIQAFAKAVSAGTLVAGAPVAVLTVPLGVGEYFDPSWSHSAWSDVFLALLPFLVAFPLVLIGGALVGLPAHFLFRRLGWEGSIPYVLTGIAGGVLITLAVLIAIRAASGFWICTLGAVSGAVTAQIWSKSMDQSGYVRLT
jgi:hypothetical protein